MWYTETMKKILTMAAVALALVGCRRTDVRAFAVAVPDMTEADLPAVTAALAPYGGVNKASLSFDAATRTLHLTYDSMQIAKKNIEMAIAKTGFAANGVTPESIGAVSRKK